MATETAAKVTFTKLKDDSWGVRVEGDQPAPGSMVDVERKDGGRVPKTIRAVVWSGKDKQTQKPIHLCSVEADGFRAATKPAGAVASTPAPAPKKGRAKKAAKIEKVRDPAFDPLCVHCRERDDVCPSCAFDE